MAWGCPECGSTQIEQRMFSVVVDRVHEPEITPDGTAGDPEEGGGVNELRTVGLQDILEDHCPEVDCHPPELRCRDCGAQFDQAVQVDSPRWD